MDNIYPSLFNPKTRYFIYVFKRQQYAEPILSNNILLEQISNYFSISKGFVNLIMQIFNCIINSCNKIKFNNLNVLDNYNIFIINVLAFKT